MKNWAEEKYPCHHSSSVNYLWCREKKATCEMSSGSNKQSRFVVLLLFMERESQRHCCPSITPLICVFHSFGQLGLTVA